FSSKTMKCRNCKSYDPNVMNEDFKQVNWLPVMTAPNVNIAVNIFNTIVKEIFDKHAPPIKKRVKGRPCPWMNNELKTTLKKRDVLLRRARKTNEDADWKAYKGQRNICNNLTRKTKGAYHKNIIKENRLNPRNFWNSIKEIFPTKSGTKNSSSKTPQTNKRFADSFGNYFSTAVRKLKTQALILKEFIWKSPRISVLRTNKTFWFDYVSKAFISSFLKR
ncbi:MAG: hypothetical protein AAFY76_13850, partial [Cyanobacteria bacterium J06649_11]